MVFFLALKFDNFLKNWYYMHQFKGELVVKIVKLIGAFLPIVAICIILQNPYKTEVKAISSNTSGEKNSYLLADANLNDTNHDSLSMTQYTNTTSHDIRLDVSNIKLTCRGKGSNREKDELIVEKNMKINALFSKVQNNEKQSSLVIGSGETVNIYVSTEYTGEIFPENEVNCGYKIAVNLGQ